MNKDSVLTLAQKEFSDKLYEPSFIILLAIFTGIIFDICKIVRVEIILGMSSGDRGIFSVNRHSSRI